MPASDGFVDYAKEQLEHFATITSKRMFGGVGLYADGLFFAVIDNDILYLKVDDSTRPEFEAAGLGPFRPYNDERTMNYHEVSVEILEDREELARWAKKAVDVATRSKKKKK